MLLEDIVVSHLEKLCGLATYTRDGRRAAFAYPMSLAYPDSIEYAVVVEIPADEDAHGSVDILATAIMNAGTNAQKEYIHHESRQGKMWVYSWFVIEPDGRPAPEHRSFLFALLNQDAHPNGVPLFIASERAVDWTRASFSDRQTVTRCKVNLESHFAPAGQGGQQVYKVLHDDLPRQPDPLDVRLKEVFGPLVNARGEAAFRAAVAFGTLMDSFFPDVLKRVPTGLTSFLVKTGLRRLESAAHRRSSVNPGL
jgi:hypothetical protein